MSASSSQVAPAVIHSLSFESVAPVESAGATGAVTPTADSVVDGRFVVPVQLDDGSLRVDPAPANDHPSLTADVQDLLMASADLSGKDAAVVGYGLITLEGAQHGQDAVHAVPGWIVFGWGGIYHCPNMTVAPSPVDLPSDGYVAVAILPGDPMSDFSYEARSNVCGTLRGPSIGIAMHVESIAWEQVGPIQQDQIKISYTLPPCGNDAAYVIAGDAAGSTVTVNASVPDAPSSCPSPVRERSRHAAAWTRWAGSAALGPVTSRPCRRWRCCTPPTGCSARSRGRGCSPSGRAHRSPRARGTAPTTRTRRR